MNPAEILQIIGGQVLLPILILLILLPNGISRHLLFINFCLTFVIYSIIFTLSTYFPHRRNVCIIQAGFVHGAVPMITISTLFMVIQIWQVIRRPTLNLIKGKAILTSMLISPYVVLVVIAVPFIIELRGRHSKLLRDDLSKAYYCSISDLSVDIPLYFAAAAAFVTIIPMADIVRGIYLHSHRSVNRRTLSSFIRTVVFTVLGILGVAGCIIFAQDTILSSTLYVIQGSVPTMAFLIFSTTRDIYFTICFWHKQDIRLYSENQGSEEKELPPLPEVASLDASQHASIPA